MSDAATTGHRLGIAGGALALLTPMTLCLAFGAQPLAADAPRHPLDPLTAAEYQAAVAALKRAKQVDEHSRYPMITLQEPSKAAVWSWQPGQPLRREAFLVIKQGAQTFEAVVDLSDDRVVSWRKVKGVQPGLLLEEWTAAQEIVLAHPGWQAAVRQRGITSVEGIVCVPLTVGYFGLADEQGRRLFKVPCFDGRNTKNFWARPIEGLTAVVDINRREVIKLIDSGAVPIPQAPADFDPAAVGTLRPAPTPLLTSQPQGSGFMLAVHEVRWQGWRFHVRLDIRVGPVVSLVRYDDHGTLRSILYQGSLSELFVPYMDPDTGWYFRTSMDAGEYGVGKFTAPLQVGVDCPAYATYMEAVLADDKEVPSSQPNAVCLFERTASDIAWRHFEIVHGQTESRQGHELVVRYIAAIGNYDYIFDWVFRQDGGIKIAVGTSGIEQVKAVTAPVMAEAQPTEDLAYGHLVAPHTLAIHHDHFFNFRLDLDVDGTQNSLLIGELTPVALGLESPPRSTYTVRSRVAKTEQEAKLHVSMDRPALWRVNNPQRSGPLGYPVSYQLVASHPAMSLLSPQDYPQRCAGFTDYHLWVTPFHPEERYAGGMYPNQSHGGDGLPHWTQANRAVDNTDIVLWYILGLHHVVRAEDWPVMPTVWHGFELRPFDFFAHNPALDLPK